MSYFLSLLFFLLSLFSTADAFAAMSCNNGRSDGLSSPGAACTALANYYGYSAFIPQYSYGSSSSTNWICRYGSDGGNYGGVSCSGSCDNGMTPNASSGFTCGCPAGQSLALDGNCAVDAPADDCSAQVGTAGRDMSGSLTDGSCGCPSSAPDFVGTASAGTCQPSCAATETRNSAGVCIPTVTCPGNLALVNGTCGCPAGQVQGTFNGVPTCASNTTTNPATPVAGVTQGGGTIVGSTGQTSTTTPNGDGTYTTTTTINNTTVVNGAAPGSGAGAGVPGGGGAGTATISNGTTTMSVVTDSTGKVISSTSTGTEQKSNDSLTLPGVEPAHAPLVTTGISGAIMNSPIVSAFTTAFGRFPTVGGCSVIVIPLFKGMVVEFKEQCRSFEAIREYLTMFAMVVYGLLSYRVFMRSASGV